MNVIERDYADVDHDRKEAARVAYIEFLRNLGVDPRHVLEVRVERPFAATVLLQEYGDPEIRAKVVYFL